MGSLHPAIVHIPIGLLFVYSCIECALLFFPRYKEKLSFGKYIMLVVGLIGSFFALSSGDNLEDTVGYDDSLVDLHSTFAEATVWVYGILAVAFTILILKNSKIVKTVIEKSKYLQKIINLIFFLSSIITRQPWLCILALLGLLLLSLTGALGGAISHGPDSDPITSFVYSLFF